MYFCYIKKKTRAIVPKKFYMSTVTIKIKHKLFNNKFSSGLEPKVNTLEECCFTIKLREIKLINLI